MNSRFFTLVLTFAVAGLAAGCSDGIKTEAKYPTGLDRNMTGEDIYGEKESILGRGGLLASRKKDEGGAAAIGVNGFLWRATLDTVSFMPLASADPFGGVILTDWYVDPENTAERVKINAFVMGRELKADGIRVRAFRQVKKGGVWVDAKTSEDTARKLEDTILARARELRIAQLGGVE
ncbi:MAG: DUF3576 domain-containing protein [Alphaproteobacteria bacterium]